MTPPNVTMQEKLSNYRIFLISAVFTAAGLIGLILVAWHLPVDKNPFWYPLLSNLSAVALTTGGLGFLWDFAGRRSLIREVLDHVDLSEEVVRAGITKAANSVEQVPWVDLFAGSSTIKIHLAYGGSWIGNNAASVRKFAQNKRNRLDLFLPDPEDEVIVASLAHRFARDPAVVRSRILEAASEMLDLAKSATGTIKVHFRTGQPTHSFYQFDQKFVLVLYPHTGIRTTETPFLILENGTFASFVKADFEALRGQSTEVEASEMTRLIGVGAGPLPIHDEL